MGDGLVAGQSGRPCYHQVNYPRAKVFLEESLALRRELGDKHRVAIDLNNLGGVLVYEGDYRAAVALA